MIHMLSRFDLNPEIAIEQFRENYEAFCHVMQTKGLIVETGKIGEREMETPMDTDEDQAPKYYSVMSFRDRQQLDEAYAYIASLGQHDKPEHVLVSTAVMNPVFTCWRDVP